MLGLQTKDYKIQKHYSTKQIKQITMARTKKHKVGDRIFYENYEGEVGTCLIKRIVEQVDYNYDKFGNPLTNGEVFKYNNYVIDEYTSIEDYMCLSENDPRVKAFCKGKKFITANFANNLRTWLTEQGAHKGDNDVVQILRDIAEEYE